MPKAEDVNEKKPGEDGQPPVAETIRDACWYMRDASQYVLANQWPDLLDLATGGSLEFVPALFTMGLPTQKFKPQEMSDKLTQHGEAYKRALAPKKEAVEEKASDKG